MDESLKLVRVWLLEFKNQQVCKVLIVFHPFKKLTSCAFIQFMMSIFYNKLIDFLLFLLHYFHPSFGRVGVGDVYVRKRIENELDRVGMRIYNNILVQKDIKLGDK